MLEKGTLFQISEGLFHRIYEIRNIQVEETTGETFLTLRNLTTDGTTTVEADWFRKRALRRISVGGRVKDKEGNIGVIQELKAPVSDRCLIVRNGSWEDEIWHWEDVLLLEESNHETE